MSYDLSLFRRESRPPLGREEFLGHFEVEGELCEVEGDRVRYHNDDTGVYFSFDYHPGGGPDEEDPNKGPTRPAAWFNLNYFRPHTFGLEAAPVLDRLVRHLELDISDPQSEGMGEGPFSTEGFLRGWNAGNRFAHQAISQLSKQGKERAVDDHACLPAALNEAIWRWNYNRRELALDWFDEEDIDVFVPRVMFIRHEGGPRTVCIWPNLIPSAVPQVDFVLVARDKLPESVRPRHTGLALVPWEDFEPACAGFRLVDDPDLTPLRCYLLDYGKEENAPETLTRLVRAVPDHAGKFEGLRPDQVLDAELLHPQKPAD